ncbi:MFS transporter [Streptacidiphilus pinicola]|uniref:MFS transporter n=1 Tax=Streptacidiphilus pinicola TaxID=2219663 RepID=A0A2X0KBR3_9ACTN|nr:MFS transporter [Streptacidiphilus pinicola]RAG84719.1 MFS transporter [Streptacidiphilus pinicola]
MTTVTSPGRGKERAGRAAGWRATWLLLAFMLVNFADKTVLGLAATPMMHDLGITHAQYGRAAAAFFALFSVAAFSVSALTRRVSTTVLLLVLALLWSAAQLPMLLGAAGFGTLLVTRVVLGAAEGPAFPVATHSLYTWFPDRERGLPTAVLSLGSAAGVALAAPLLTVVINGAGWRWAFGAVGLAGLVWALVWLRLGREGPEPIRAPARDRDEAAGRATSDGPAQPLRRILLTGTWIACALGSFASYWQTTSALTWGADYLRTVGGLTTTQTGLVAMGTGLSSALAILAFGVLSQRARRRGGTLGGVARWTGVAMVLAGISGAVFALTGSVPLKIALAVGPSVLATVMLVFGQTAVARIAPPERRGTLLGATAFVYSLAGVLSPLVIGSLTTGSRLSAGYRDGYLLTAALVGVTGVLVALTVRPERDADRLGIPTPQDA